jgi:hypothetical protein
MSRRILQSGVWLTAVALVILLARTLAYAVVPSPAARLLEQRGGGPALPVLTLVTLGLGAALAVAICWLAALGVQERASLESRAAPRLRLLRMLVSALVLAVVTSLLGGLFEAYIHWRAGLGWHGLHCVFGPVHRDLIPIASGLSFVAAAAIEACALVTAWMRRTLASLRVPTRRVLAAALLPAPRSIALPNRPLRAGTRSPRGPPAFS